MIEETGLSLDPSVPGSHSSQNAFRITAREWLYAAVDLLAPPLCAGCGRLGASWCRDCTAQTAVIGPDACLACGAPGGLAGCPSCAEAPAAFEQARAYARYKNPFKHAVVRLKHHRDHPLGDLLAQLVLESAQSFSIPFDALVVVPLSAQKLAARGYNQVDLFARPLAGRLGVPYLPRALERTRETRSQVGLSGSERRQNLNRAFAADPAQVRGRRILLVDDVYTTGTTGNACARALRDAGAAAVLLFTLARAAGADDDLSDDKLQGE